MKLWPCSRHLRARMKRCLKEASISWRLPISPCWRFNMTTCAPTLISLLILKVGTTLPGKLCRGMITIRSAHGGSSFWLYRTSLMNSMVSLMMVVLTRRLVTRKQLVMELAQMLLWEFKRENRRISKRAKNASQISRTSISMKMVLSRLKLSISRMLQSSITSSTQKWCSLGHHSYKTMPSSSAT